MNLYNFHTDPKSLKHHDAAHEHVPNLKWKKICGQWPTRGDKRNVDFKELKKYEQLWAKDAQIAYDYALHVLNGPFPAGEKAIATNGKLSYYYAMNNNKRFPAGEPALSELIRNYNEYDGGYEPFETPDDFLERYQEEFNVEL